MANRYQLSNWTHERDSELVNTLNKKSTGIMVHLWGGWLWTHESRQYRTDGEGYGLWLRLQNGDWSQCRGTGQFSLPRDRQPTIAKLRREGLAPDPTA